MAEQTENDGIFDVSEGGEGLNPEIIEESPVEASQDAEMQGQDAEGTDDGAEENVNQGADNDWLPGYLQSKHIDPSDPEALQKVSDMYRNAEKKMYEESQKRASLERLQSQPQALNPSDTVALAEVRALKNQMMARDFIAQNNVTPEVEQEMCEYLEQAVKLPTGEVVRRAELVTAGLMSLGEVYRLVGANQIDPNAIKDQVRRQTLAEVANKQNAARTKASATNGQQFEVKSKDPMIEGMLSAL